MTKKKSLVTVEQQIAAVAAETDQHVVELARRMGPDVLRFLQQVMSDDYRALGFENPISAANRLAAADLIRKFSAIPTNIDLGLKAPPTLIYTGEPRERPALPAEVTIASEVRASLPAILWDAVEPESEAVADPSDNQELGDD